VSEESGRREESAELTEWPQVEAGPEGGWIGWVLGILLLFGLFLWVILH
jgi:hypothetical protein